MSARRPPIHTRSFGLWAVAVAMCLAVAAPASALQVRSGQYVGDGSDGRVIDGLGFQPVVVIVKGNVVKSAFLRSATMAPGESVSLHDDKAPYLDRIEALLADGFTIGTSNEVNGSRTDYWWIAFAEDPGNLALGTFMGNGSVQTINDVGFEPAYMIVMSEKNKHPYQRMSGMPAGMSAALRDDALKADQITAFLPTGFSVGSGDHVNSPDELSHYIAWKSVPGEMAVGSYVGDDSALRSIGGIGFQPDYVIVKAETSERGVHRPSSLPGNSTLIFKNNDNIPNAIVELQADGFSVGGEKEVNEGTKVIYWAAFHEPKADLEVSTSITPSLANPGDLVSVTIKLGNGGPDAATGLSLAHTLPVGLTHVSATPTVGSYDAGTGIWTVGTLAAPAAANLTITATVDAGTGGTILTDEVSVATLDQYDPNAVNNTASAGVYVQLSDLGLTMITDAVDPVEGQTVQFGIQLMNNGPDASTGIVVSDLLPAGLTYQSHTLSLGSYDPLSGEWSMSTLGSGSSAMLRLFAVVDDGTLGQTIVNTASVTAADVEDGNATNDMASVTFTIPTADLSLGISADDTNPPNGATVRLTATLENQGPRDATDIIVDLPMPAGLSHLVSIPSVGSYDPVAGTWTITSLAQGVTATLEIDVDVTATSGSVLDVTATRRSSLPGDPDPIDDTASIELVVQGSDLAVTLTASAPAVDVGGAVTYTLTVENVGGGIATGVAVADTLPTGLTFSGAVPSQGSYDPGTGLWTIGTLGPASSCVLLLSADVDPGTGGTILTDTAVVASMNESDADPSNDTASVDVRVKAADLRLIKNVDNPSPNMGESVVFSLVLTNLGPDDAANVAVADTLPAGLVFQGAVPSAGSYDPGTGIWTVGGLASGVTETLDIQALVQLDVGGGDTTVNTARITASDQEDPVVDNNVDTATLTQQSADLAVVLDVDDATPAAGDSVALRVAVTNDGPSSAQGVDILAALPAGLTYVSHAPPGAVFDQGSGIWSAGTLANGETDTLRIQATVDADSSGAVLTAVASVDAVVQSDPDGNDNTDSAVVTVRSADLSLAMTAIPVRPTEGDTVIIDVELDNLGADRAETAEVLVTLPPGLTLLGAVPGAGSFDGPSGRWTLTDLDPGSPVALTLEAVVGAGMIGDVLTIASVVDAVHPGDPVAGNDSASADVTVAGADLALTMGVNIDSPNQGDSVLYTLALVNHGPDDVGHAVVSDPIPDGLVYLSHTPPTHDYDPVTGLWTVGPVASGQTANLFLQAVVQAGDPGEEFINAAMIADSDLADPVGGNDAAQVSIRVPAADLRVSLLADDISPATGDPLALTMTVANAGPDTARGVVITNLLPADLTFVLADDPGYDPLTGRWVVGELANGADAMVTLHTIVDATAAGDKLTISASVAEVEQGDPAAGDESDELSLLVESDADLTVAILADDATPSVGGTVTWSIQLTNDGPNEATNITVRDSLDVGLDPTTASPGVGTYDPVTRTWSVPSLAADETVTLALESLVLTGTGGQDLVTHVSVLGSDQHDLVPGNDGAEAAVHVPGSDLSITSYIDLESPNEGDEIILTLYLANQGPDRATGVAVLDSLPAGLTYVGHTPPLESYVRDEGSGVWRWDVGSLEPQSSRALFVRASVDEGTTGEVLTHRARIEEFAEEDPNSADNESINDIQVGGADLVLAMTTNADDPDEGDVVTFHLTVTNAGPNGATGVAVLDSLPAGLEPLGSDRPAAYDPATGVWTVGDLAPSDSDDLTLMARVGERTGGSRLVNTAWVADLDQVDPVATNDTVSVAFDVAWPEQGRVLVSAHGEFSGLSAPGQQEQDVLLMELVNWSVAPDTLMALAVRNVAEGEGSPSEMDESWLGVSLWRLELDGSRSRLADTVDFDSGLASFTGLGLTIVPGDTLRLAVMGAPSSGARDGDLLAVSCDGPDDLTFTRPVQLEGDWPLASDGGLLVDGFVAAQVLVHEIAAGVVPPGQEHLCVLDVVLPGDGYADDVLQEIQVVNQGDARAGLDLINVALWQDDGDGGFTPGTDLPLGSFAHTGDRWILTGVDHHLPSAGIRLFVCVDVAPAAESGRTVRFGVPLGGVVVSGDNDGPRDGDVVNPYEMVVSAADRLYVSAGGSGWDTTHPGDSGVELLEIAVTNTYTEARSLRNLVLTNLTRSTYSDDSLVLDGVLGSLSLIEAGGEHLGAASFEAGRAVFSGLDWSVPPSETRHLMVKAAVSPTGAADGDSVAVMVAGTLDVQFDGESEVSADWPVAGNGGAVVDGHVVSQIMFHATDVVTIGAGEGPVLVLDITVPGNGHATDVLSSMRLENVGSATEESIASLQLWSDGGDDDFDAGDVDDELVGTLQVRGTTWYLSDLALAVPPEGRRIFVSATASNGIHHATDLDLELPEGGLIYASGNDGPVGGGWNPDGRILFSTSPLQAALAFDTSIAGVGQSIQLEMTVRNTGLEPVLGVAPAAPVMSGDGALDVDPGVAPVTADLDHGEEVTFRWNVDAVEAGSVAAAVTAAGIGAFGSGLMTSAMIESSPLTITTPPSAVALGVLSQLPFTVNQGQAEVNALNLDLTLVDAGSSSAALLDTLLVLCEDDEGVPLPAGSVLEQIAVVQDGLVMGTATLVPGDGPLSIVTLDQPVQIEAVGPTRISLRVDVASEAADSVFRLSLPTPASIPVRDGVSGAAVPVTLSEGSFPVRSEAAQVVTGAEALVVSVGSASGGVATRGQADVQVMVLELRNSGLENQGAGIQLGAVAVTVADGSGVAFPDLTIVASRVTATLDGITLGSIPIVPGTGPNVILPFDSPLALEAAEQHDVELTLDLVPATPAAAIRILVDHTDGWDARDENTGVPLPIILEPAPMVGPETTLLDPVGTIHIAGGPVGVFGLTGGATNLAVLDVAVRHPGTVGVAAARLDTLLIRARTPNGAPARADVFLSSVGIRSGGVSLGVSTDLSSPDGIVRLPLTGAILEAGATRTLTVVVDPRAVSVSDTLVLTLEPGDIKAVDDNLGSTVAVTPDIGALMPLSTGPRTLHLPSDELRTAWQDRMPAVLSTMTGEEPVASLTLENPAEAPAGDLLVTSLGLRVRSGGAAVAAGSVLRRVVASVDGVPWAETADLAPADTVAVLHPLSDLRLPAGEDVDVELSIELQPHPAASSVELGLTADLIEVSQPEGDLVEVSILAADGQAFPFWTQTGNVSGGGLDETYSNFPNPFAAGREFTTFVYALPSDADVTIRLFSARGEPVAVPVDRERREAGLHQDDRWDGRNGRGDTVRNGVYIAEIVVEYLDGERRTLRRKVAVVR